MNDNEFAHPGRLLKAEIRRRALSPHDAATALGLAPHELADVLAGLSPVTVDIAMAAADNLGRTALEWLDMQRVYEAHIADVIARA